MGEPQSVLDKALRAIRKDWEAPLIEEINELRYLVTMADALFMDGGSQGAQTEYAYWRGRYSDNFPDLCFPEPAELLFARRRKKEL